MDGEVKLITKITLETYRVLSSSKMRATANWLLRRGANPNASSVPMPVLLYAVKAADVEAVRTVLMKKASPNVLLPVCSAAPSSTVVSIAFEFEFCFCFLGVA